MATRAAFLVRVFAIFFDVSRNVSRCQRCHTMSRNMYIFNPGGLPYERGGDARQNFELNSLRRPTSAWANLFLPPRACLHEGGGPWVGEVVSWCGKLPHLTCKRDHIKMRDYMGRRITPPKRCSRRYFKSFLIPRWRQRGRKKRVLWKTVLHISAFHFNRKFPNASFYGDRSTDTRQRVFKFLFWNWVK